MSRILVQFSSLGLLVIEIILLYYYITILIFIFLIHYIMYYYYVYYYYFYIYCIYVVLYYHFRNQKKTLTLISQPDRFEPQKEKHSHTHPDNFLTQTLRPGDFDSQKRPLAPAHHPLETTDPFNPSKNPTQTKSALW